MATEETLVLVKPDGVARGLTGAILARIEAKGYSLVDIRLVEPDRGRLERHYAEHDGKPFYADLVEFITRSPSLIAVIEGPEDTWKVVRTMMGATNPRESAPGTIRGDLGILFTENLVHGSDSAESAAREIGIWFPDLV